MSLQPWSAPVQTYRTPQTTQQEQDWRAQAAEARKAQEQWFQERRRQRDERDGLITRGWLLRRTLRQRVSPWRLPLAENEQLAQLDRDSSALWLVRTALCDLPGRQQVRLLFELARMCRQQFGGDPELPAYQLVAQYLTADVRGVVGFRGLLLQARRAAWQDLPGTAQSRFPYISGYAATAAASFRIEHTHPDYVPYEAEVPRETVGQWKARWPMLLAIADARTAWITWSPFDL